MGRDNKNHRRFPFWPGWNFKGWKRVIFILHFNYPRPLMLVVDISGKSQGHEVNGITLRVNFPQGAIHILCFAAKSAIGQQGFANYYRLHET